MLARVNLPTPRLVLLPLSRGVIARRLAETSGFVESCDLGDGPVPVRFPHEWPGDAVALFPHYLTALKQDGDAVRGSYAAVERETGTAIGMLGSKGVPIAGRPVEIGYGFSPSHWSRGYATEAVAAVVSSLFADGVSLVRAETAVGNTASQRVLEKNGFEETGNRWNDDDGELILWERRP